MENLTPVSKLREIVARLRSPGGCPWDREQTHESLRGALIEECYEVVDAIESSDDANLREELGDLLLHVVMHARMAEEREAFTFEEIAAGVCEKMIRRHPHVFGDTLAGDSAEVLRQWEQIKRQEKGAGAGVMDHLSKALPALMRAQNAQKKAGRVGFDWPEIGPVFDKLAEEVTELRSALAAGDPRAVEEEVGDVLFTAVNLARKAGVDAETTLAAATSKFIARFQTVEKHLQTEGRRMEQCSAEELDRLWEQAKAG